MLIYVAVYSDLAFAYYTSNMTLMSCNMHIMIFGRFFKPRKSHKSEMYQSFHKYHCRICVRLYFKEENL